MTEESSMSGRGERNLGPLALHFRRSRHFAWRRSDTMKRGVRSPAFRRKGVGVIQSVFPAAFRLKAGLRAYFPQEPDYGRCPPSPVSTGGPALIQALVPPTILNSSRKPLRRNMPVPAEER